MRTSRIPTIVGILILVLGVAAGVLLVQYRQIFRIGAATEFAPKDVRIANIGDNSFNVSWVTDRETQGFVSWGESEGSLTQTTEDEIGPSGFIHTATLRPLKPQTSYFFKINSGGNLYDNSGVAWQAKTGPAIGQPTRVNLISGSVITPSGTPSKNSLVYVSVSGSLLMSVTSQNGSWVVPLSAARSADLTSYLTIDEKNTLLDISVQAGPDGVASAKIYPQSAKPAPAIVLGQSHDYRSLPPSKTGGLPEASIGIPPEGTPSSGFNVPQGTSAPSSKTVTLTSLKEGEAVTSTKPEFFGEGPAGTTITITLQSEAQTAQITIPSTGAWKWDPSLALSGGSHNITITWKDTSGITRTLKRTFIVQAAEGPAFVSTPSGTPTSTPKSTPTVTPKITATPSATPKVPVSGSLTPTLLLSIMGLGAIVIFGSIFIFY